MGNNAVRSIAPLVICTNTIEYLRPRATVVALTPTHGSAPALGGMGRRQIIGTAPKSATKRADNVTVLATVEPVERIVKRMWLLLLFS